MKKSVKFSPEVGERAVRMVAECRGDYPSQWGAVESVAAKIGCTPQALLNQVRQTKTSGILSIAQADGQSEARQGARAAPCQRDSETCQRVFRLRSVRAQSEE